MKNYGMDHIKYMFVQVDRIAKLVEPNELTERRQHIVDQLNMIVRICFETIMTNAGYSREQARQAGGFVTPFGSYKLDVHSPDSDIDAYVYLLVLFVSFFYLGMNETR